MEMLEGLKPEEVFYYFEKICGIPHGSGNTKQISDYLADFAKKRNLEHYQDEVGNVIIIKDASSGYEDHEPVILQGHMDMVAVKAPSASIDMEKDGLKLIVDGDRLMAEGTSLGGDDGIAVAYGLALLAGEYCHPRIEAVFTVDEEVGMNGARALDVSPIRAKRLINLDSEEEGVFLAGCAGGARVNISLSCEKVKREGIPCEVRISGLLGGHSGEEIGRERGNAICLLGRVLDNLFRKLDFCIENMQGGVADNAIPSSAKADILIAGYAKGGDGPEKGQCGFSVEECTRIVNGVCEKINRELKEELAGKDEDVKVEAVCGQIRDGAVAEGTLAKRMVSLLLGLPWGVQAMSAAMPGLVETSLNPGLLSMEEDCLKIDISVRSSLESARKALTGRLESLAYLAQAQIEVTGEYPGWAFKKESPLREKMAEVYRKLYNREPVVEAIHAGLECGLLAHKIPGLDCVSIGPDMKNIHTAKEELSISSASQVWEYLLKLLKEL
ncbi:MAG: aminoacyl-histidine dipeptidase [Lachnospiraceae bacterium]|nr:aminoacyl-histidine dipeptidase [Lachnospiraceae bacterium]